MRTLTLIALGFGLASVGTLFLAIATDYWLFTSEPVDFETMILDGQSEVSITGQSEVSITSQSEVSITGQSEVSITGQSEVINTDQSDVSNTGQSEVSVSLAN